MNIEHIKPGEYETVTGSIYTVLGVGKKFVFVIDHMGNELLHSPSYLVREHVPEVPEPPSRYVEVPITIKFGLPSWEAIAAGQLVGYRYACESEIYYKHGPTAFKDGRGNLCAWATGEDLRGSKQLVVATHAVFTVLTTEDREG